MPEERLTPAEREAHIEDSIKNYPKDGTSLGGGTTSSIPAWHRTNKERLHLPGMMFCPKCEAEGKNAVRLGTRRCCQFCGTALERRPMQESRAIVFSASVIRALAVKE